MSKAEKDIIFLEIHVHFFKYIPTIIIRLKVLDMCSSSININFYYMKRNNPQFHWQTFNYSPHNDIHRPNNPLKPCDPQKVRLSWKEYTKSHFVGKDVSAINSSESIESRDKIESILTSLLRKECNKRIKEKRMIWMIRSTESSNGTVTELNLQSERKI